MFRGIVRISVLSAFMLVLVRIAIGWHFLYEGVSKYENPAFSASGLFRQARGPFADYFQSLIPDYDGRERLSVEETSARWDEYRRKFGEHYGLSPEQSAAADKILAERKAELAEFRNGLAEVDPDAKEVKDEVAAYLAELEAHKALRETDPTIDDVPHQKQRYYEQDQQIRAKAAPWLAEIDRIEREYKKDLSLLLADEQQGRGSVDSLSWSDWLDLGNQRTRLDRINVLTTYGLMAIGLCLMIGLFSRLANLAGAAFLGMVILSSPAWPTLYPPLPLSAGHSILVNKEFVEMLVMLALATTPVGRWAGLDAVIHYLLFGSRRARGK